MIKNPLVFEINAQKWLYRLRDQYGLGIHLGNIPDRELQQLESYGINYLWLMGVWQTGKESRQKSIAWARENSAFKQALPGFGDSDICGSPYAISEYAVMSRLGDRDDLAELRSRLKMKNIGLLLDFVPNHVALDHPWRNSHPEYFIPDGQNKSFTDPDLFYINNGNALAYGKDPYFPAWTDTLQLNYFNLSLREAQVKNLEKIADLCDGVRCDMAMLVTNEVFDRTWRHLLNGQPIPEKEFWPATIKAIKQQYPEFIFIAEVYWDMEWQLQQMGFDFTYDKRLYDRLLQGSTEPVQAHLRAAPDFRDRSLRFVENHDEKRAVVAFGRERSLAAAAIAFTVPGMRLLHDGQVQGRKVKQPVQMRRTKHESDDFIVRDFYLKLLHVCNEPVFHAGTWELLEDPRVLAWSWIQGKQRRFILINYNDYAIEFYLDLNRFGQGKKLSDMLDETETFRSSDRGFKINLKRYQVRILKF